MDNSMRLICAITAVARGLGMSYGRFVAAYGDILPASADDDAQETRTCADCGAQYVPAGPRMRRCPACAEKERARRAAQAPVYERACTRCGTTVHTRQPPRPGMNLYCAACKRRRGGRR